jgi:dihydroneopterin aldolase
MRRRKTTPPDRFQQQTPFGEILGRLLELAPGVSAAVLVDPEGETVDYAGAVSDYDTKVSGAHFRVVIDEVAERLSDKLGRVHHVVVRARKRSYLVRALHDGYALVVVLKRDVFGISFRAIDLSERDLCEEAGWPTPAARGTSWYPVEIETAPRDRRRPSRVRTSAAWEGVEVLGSVVGMGRERGYRCRLRSGAELTLVREPAGTWYSDERIDQKDDEPANSKKKR